MEKGKSIVKVLVKYKYPCLILALGILLMLLPHESNAEDKDRDHTSETIGIKTDSAEWSGLAEKMEQLLGEMEGIGRVKVLISIEKGVSYEYQQDTEITVDDNRTQKRMQTTMAAASGGVKSPVIIRTIYPVYQGAAILCEGADDPALRLAIIKTVSALTGLRSDKISIIKMRGN